MFVEVQPAAFADTARVTHALLFAALAVFHPLESITVLRIREHGLIDPEVSSRTAPTVTVTHEAGYSIPEPGSGERWNSAASWKVWLFAPRRQQLARTEDQVS